MKSGIEIINDISGNGDAINRGHTYSVRLRMWLNKGDPVVWKEPWGLISNARLEESGQTMFTDLRIDRVDLVNGLFYGVEGMRIGGIRKLRIAPHLAYAEKGIEGVIPANALLIIEIQILKEMSAG